jgi:PAS domain S-box-containing protein/putative nucleotidyltransferase with HDIG domain
MLQPTGASNLPAQEGVAISQDQPPNFNPDPEEDIRKSPDASASSTGQEPSDTTAEKEAGSGTFLSPTPAPSLKKVLEGISASLDELQAVVKEADLQSDKAPASAPPGAAAADQGYRDLFALAPEAYLVTDAQTFIQEANPAAAAMLNLDPASLQGKSLAQFVTPADRGAFHSSLIRVQQGGGQRNWEFTLQPEAGKPLTVAANVSAQTDHRDQVIRVLWLLRDIRETRAEEDRLKSLLTRIKNSFFGIITAFAETVEIKDPQTAGHQQRVAQLAVAIGREMGFSLNRLEGIRVAGLLHDIGKIGIPLEILAKPGPLTDLEIEFVKTHGELGCDLLKNIDFPWPVLQAIRQHHERLDGSGYPAGLTGEDIILEARILGVADVVDAMVSTRSYGPAQGIDKALKEIQKNAGVLYDPKVVDVCLQLFVEKGFSFN